MKKFEIEYTTNHADRQTITIVARDLTEAYLKCVYAFPIYYIITDIKEINDESFSCV